ncbi:MAG: hypothetical protein HC916_06925 [Coleofasciculaceae cyanobacterium SM2_1_6]|nr:hypothetical protein [Coleofasciculaceae cyanobacterium SM2_1_6]
MAEGKFGDLIKQARKPANQQTSKPDNQITDLPNNQQTSKPANQKEVNLCVKVPESLRRHWAAESKRQGVTMTEIIIQALSDRFGTPS